MVLWRLANRDEFPRLVSAWFLSPCIQGMWLPVCCFSVSLSLVSGKTTDFFYALKFFILLFFWSSLSFIVECLGFLMETITQSAQKDAFTSFLWGCWIIPETNLIMVNVLSDVACNWLAINLLRIFFYVSQWYWSVIFSSVWIY